MINKEKSLIIIVKSDYQLLNAIVSKNIKNEHYKEVIVHYSGYWDNASIVQKYAESIGYSFNNDINDIFSDLKGKRLDIISAKFNPLLKLKFNIDNYTCVDDGLGSYADFFHLYKAAVREKNSFKIKAFYPCYYFFSKLIYKLKLYEKDHVYKNNEIDKDYKQCLIELLSEVVDALNVDVLHEKYHNRPLFCTQPYIELGILSEKEYSDFLSKAELYYGEKLLILKHPGDKFFNYDGYDIIECSMFELFIAKNKDYISSVSSINSTCLLNASSIFDMKSISFNNEKTKVLENNFSKTIRRLWDKYVFGVIF